MDRIHIINNTIMKTKIFFLLVAVALVTLSFTFSQVNSSAIKNVNIINKNNESGPVGGFFADEVTK